jgi:type VI secretion system secreted protein VgrG
MFAGLEPATSAFDAKWREVAGKYPKDFEDEQHEYVRKNYYAVMLANLQRQGLNLSNYGPGVQDLIWSTAVQFGPARTAIFTEPLKGKSTLTDTDIINLVSEYKKNNVNVFFRSSGTSIQNSQKSRYTSEQAALLQLVTA